MTSAPNLRPLSNGNKLWLFLLPLLFLLACDPAKRTTQTTYPNKPRPEQGLPPKPKKDKPASTNPIVKTPPKKDTVPPPTTVPDEPAYHETVDIALLLPFLSSRLDPTAPGIPPKSKIAVNFYAGLKLAMEDKGLDDFAINIHVLDTKAEFNETLNLTNSMTFKNADLIIGPFRKKNAAIVAGKAVQQNQVMLSPFSPIDPAGLAGNGKVIQSFASLDTYMQAILNFLIGEGYNKNIVVIKRKSGGDDRAIRSLLRAYEKTTLSKLTPLNVIVADDSDLSFDKLDLRKFLITHPNTAFIIPTWKDPNYISAIVRKIYVSRGEDEMPTVIGMPQWVQFKNLDFQKLDIMNTYIPATDVIYQTPATKAFAKKYFEAYHGLPDKYAYRGYDVGRYVLQLIEANRHGPFNVPDSKGLFFDYRFEPSTDGTLYKNSFVRIYRMDNFRLVNPDIE